MNTTLYYFSGTGNTLYVAKKLSELLTGAVLVPILPLLEGEEKIVLNKGTVGILYPVYANGLPKPVRAFIARCDFSMVDSVFAVSTHGGIPGKDGALMSHVLGLQGVKLGDFFSLKMLLNSPKGVAPKFLMTLDWETKITEALIQSMKKRTDAGIVQIVETLQKGKHNYPDILKGDAKQSANVLTKILWQLSKGSNPKLDFILDQTCIGCGTCEKVCLSKRIMMEDNHPTWKTEACFYCYACFNFCPTQAIGVKYYTKKMGRYHCPTITSEEIAKQKKEKVRLV